MIRQEDREAGDSVFLKLDHYDPAWRQALVVRKASRLGRLILAKRNQTRDSCAHPHRALEIGTEPLLEACQAKMESEDLHFVTASEDVAPEGAKKSLEVMSSDSSDVESEDDEIYGMLKAAKKSKPDRATGSADRIDKSGSKTHRYPLLESSSKNMTSGRTHLEKLLEKSVVSGNGDPTGANISALVNLELLKLLKGKKKDRMQLETDNSSADDTDPSTSDSQDSKRTRGAGKALKDFRHGHRRMKRKPLKHVRKYVREVESHLGVTAQSPYRLTDYSRRLSWGKQKSLMRIHYAVSELLQVLLKGKVERAALQAVQLLRALHQVCLDQGSWQAASLLLAHVDPLERPKFGGNPIN